MDDSKEKLLNLCVSGMAAKGLLGREFKDRLKVEIKEIENQAEYDYFLELYERRAKFQKNENNLLVPYLLGLTDEFDISSEPAHIQGEFPDIDVDYLPVVQEYLRKDWCPRRFGRDKVVNIGNYGTFGIKSALLDMARVHSADYQEIQTITKNLQDKDDEGKPLTWDKAIEVAPDLAAYCEKNPEIADSAKRLIDRNRGRGKHAGGTVVSNINISDLVPVMIDTDGNPVSGWTEGLHDQDLQPVGLIKFDILAVKDLLRIAHCCHLVKQRHPEVKSISAVEGGSDWSNTSYLNDRKALELANKSETRGIFQFDGEGMRKLIKAGGVDRFEDLVAYSALFRPAAIGLKMHERYVERKKGREEWEDQVPECMRETLSKTYGIMIYQESVMKVLNVVGDIPLVHCEKIRKAISKKKVKEFIKYKQMFLENGSKKTGWPIESDDEKNMNFLWSQLENFSSYGFNLSHAVAYTHTSSRLLYLKAHYPLEFFCSTLGLEGDEDKVKMYKREAERSGIKINRCDLNKSKVNYEIVGEEIYVGFSNIKGIGKEVAERIVSLQPFSGFPDFLDRFGTDKRIVEPLVCLGAFKDAAPNVLLEFYEDYKKWSKGNIDKEKRQMKRRDELAQSIKSMLKEGSESCLEHNFLMNVFESGDASAMKTFISKEFSISDVFGVVKKYAKSALDFEHKVNFSKANSISFENWTSQNRHPSDKWPNIFELERKYYGFSWEHPIQKSPDYIGGHSFGIFKDNDDVVNAGVEVMITKGPQEKKSKKGNKYHFILVEDEDWNVEVVTFWSEDYARFEEELKYWNEEQNRGHFMRLRLTRPGSGFKSYTFESPAKAVRYKLIPADKKNDPRLQIMESPM
jgi:DNA polymerase III alpha subunit